MAHDTTSTTNNYEINRSNLSEIDLRFSILELMVSKTNFFVDGKTDFNRAAQWDRDIHFKNIGRRIYLYP